MESEDVKHWADQLKEKIIKEREEKERYVFNCGMSISGMMHIGNLRGELLIPSSIAKIFESTEKKVDFKGVYYTQDRFKARDGQVQNFENPEDAKKYKGWRLIDVPDPKDCHENWVEHFNSKNDPFLSKFGIEVDPITTTEFYRMEETKSLVKGFLKERNRVRKILNQYRERNPYPEGWIPFDPLCKKCRRIDSTESIDLDFKEERVKYKCNSCGSEGWSSIENGKLAWRLEWSALWEILEVDFEPFGKDHATPGGSRDSCVKLSKEFGLNYPSGFPFNWVYWKKDGNIKEMTSSGNVGMTAEDFLEIAEPEVLNYLYISTKPMKEIYFNPLELPTYTRRFDRAEAVYFDEKEARTEKRGMNMKRNYELAVKEVPDKKPLRVPYGTCAFVAQLAEKEDRLLELTKKTGQIPDTVSGKDKGAILNRIKRAGKWIKKFNPEQHVIKVQENVLDVKDRLSEEQKEVLRKLREDLEEKQWKPDELQNRIYQFKEEYGISAGEVFQAVYLAVLGKKSGPRAGQLIKAVGQDKVVKILNGI